MNLAAIKEAPTLAAALSARLSEMSTACASAMSFAMAPPGISGPAECSRHHRAVETLTVPAIADPLTVAAGTVVPADAFYEALADRCARGVMIHASALWSKS